MTTAVTRHQHDQIGSLQVLEWRLKQRDEEIMILLQKMQSLEEKLEEQGGKAQRMETCNSVGYYSTNKTH